MDIQNVACGEMKNPLSYGVFSDIYHHHVEPRVGYYTRRTIGLTSTSSPRVTGAPTQRDLDEHLEDIEEGGCVDIRYLERLAKNSGIHIYELVVVLLQRGYYNLFGTWWNRAIEEEEDPIQMLAHTMHIPYVIILSNTMSDGYYTLFAHSYGKNPSTIIGMLRNNGYRTKRVTGLHCSFDSIPEEELTVLNNIAKRGSIDDLSMALREPVGDIALSALLQGYYLLVDKILKSTFSDNAARDLGAYHGMLVRYTGDTDPFPIDTEVYWDLLPGLS